MRKRWFGGILLILATGWSALGAVIDNTWCRFESPGFELITDLPLTEAQQLITSLEQFRLTADNLIASEVHADSPIKAVVFKRRKDFTTVFDVKGFAGFMRPSLNSNTLILGPDRRGDYLAETAFHEYTHHLLRSQGRNSYPMWFEEGFASFMASLKQDFDGWRIGNMVSYRNPHSQNVVNQNNVNQQLIFESSHLKDRPELSLEEILSAKSLQNWPTAELVLFYERSWLLVHMLKLGHEVGLSDRRSQIADYLDLIDQGTTWQQAFKRTFDVSVSELERQLNRYSRRLMLPTEKITGVINHLDDSSPTGCMSRSEIALELGLASVHFNQDYASELLSVAFEIDNQESQALVGLSMANKYQGDFDTALMEAKRAVMLDKKSVRAKVQLANVLLDSCSQGQSSCDAHVKAARDLYIQSVELDGSRVDAVFGLGISYFFLGEHQAAIQQLQKAFAKAPWAPRINLFLGEAYRLTGKNEKAKEHLTKALRWEAEPEWRDKAQQALALL